MDNQSENEEGGDDDISRPYRGIDEEVAEELRFELSLVEGRVVGDEGITQEDPKHEEEVQEHSERME